MNKEVIEFLTTVVEKRQIRTEHMLSLSSCTKIIPVISTYSQIGIGEENSIPLQVNDLRSTFQTIAFRTSELTFASDLVQINSVAQPQDFLFIDLGELCLSNQDDLDTIDYLVAKLKTFDKCSVVFINSPIVHTTTNSGLDHGKKIAGTNNDLMNKFSSYGAHCFADYSGIKKDLVEEGRGISPGFIFYDAIGNEFYGYKGRKWKKPEKPDLDDFREIIIRDLLTSEVVAHLKSSHLLYLCSANKGWKMINDMWDRTEKWKSQAKFKRISMEHYLHCIKTKIEAGYFQV